MLKVKLIDHEVIEATKGDEEFYDLVSKTESILNEILNKSDVCINDISDNGMVINGLIKLSKDALVVAAHERKAIFTILKNQEELMDAIKNINNKIDNLDK